MKVSHPLIEFTKNPDEATVTAWWDPDTKTLAHQCPTCGTETRHTKEELERFLFTHEPWCTPSLRKEWTEAR